MATSTWRITRRLLRQDWRSGELYMLGAALILTVAAISAVGFFTDRIETGMIRQGGELIAADLAIDGSSPPPQDYLEQATRRGLVAARTLEFPSVVMGTEGPQLVQVKAADAPYPLRGRLRVQDGFTAPERTVEQGPPRGEVWVEARLLRLLGEPLGAAVGLGETRLRLGAILSYEPDRGGGLFQFAPRVLINAADLPATGLVSPASRVKHRLLLAGDLAAVDAYSAWLKPRLPVNLTLVDGRTARPEFESALDRASRFLHLATLVTLLVAGSAIALASRRLVERQIDAVAIMRCLGAPRHLLMRVFVLRLALFGLMASLVGCLVGWLGQLALVATVAEWFGADLPPASWRPVAVGVATGMIALLGFAVPPLLQLTRVSPLRALRRDLGTPRASAALAVLGAALALALLILWQARDAELAGKLLGGVALTVGTLVLSVLALVRLARELAGRARGVWRLGLAALTRRPTFAVLQIAGFGLGILALLLLAVVRVDLLKTWQEGLPPGAPNHFLVNIQPQEVEPVRAFLHGQGIAQAELFPMIRGRLTRINDRPINPADYENPRAERLAAREFNLSFAERLQTDNGITAGEWWPSGTRAPAFSVEQGLAETLGIKLGDRLTFFISGHEVAAPVTSLRKVRWDSFNVNFFVVSPPALLGAEAATYITSFHLPHAREAMIPELVRHFPSVTLLNVDALLKQVRAVVERGVLAVETVFLFTLAAGMLVMFAGIQASLAERRTEHGILRTLGAGRRALLGSLAVEFTATGLLAGLLASIFAELTGWLLAERLFGLQFGFNPALWLTGVLGSGLLIGLAGTLATYPLLIRPPLQTLRQAG
ncbi:FtsX-like permease family protein [uncultured Thiodictyon sp.]|uniref:ABC transporter permease n=1 Tax=uncultured Thiodictyon sp. TaxID=1846217 RepID=UPI0025E830BC|nr:FtsX-like permease family protein [uncultured Thiodictyon sp.]